MQALARKASNKLGSIESALLKSCMHREWFKWNRVEPLK